MFQGIVHIVEDVCPGQARQQADPELAAPNRPFPLIAPASRLLLLEEDKSCRAGRAGTKLRAKPKRKTIWRSRKVPYSTPRHPNRAAAGSSSRSRLIAIPNSARRCAILSRRLTIRRRSESPFFG